MAFGLQFFDAAGNLVLDTTTLTVKDFGIYEIASVTADTTITLPVSGLPPETEVLVINNTGDEDTAAALPSVILNRSGGTIDVVAGGGTSFNVGIKVLHLE